MGDAVRVLEAQSAGASPGRQSLGKSPRKQAAGSRRTHSGQSGAHHPPGHLCQDTCSRRPGNGTIVVHLTGGFLRAQQATRRPHAEAGAVVTPDLESVHAASAGQPQPQAPRLFWARLSMPSPGPGGLRSPTALVSRGSLPPPPLQGAGCYHTSVPVTSSNRRSWPLINKTIFLSNSARLRIATAR